MPIEPGQILGHYRVAEKIGEGGMGVVYRAEDTRLGRAVAIKILPAQVADDPERLARFEREARVLASLNHPNIAAIHGLENHQGVRFLALELVEGDDLFQRLKAGPIHVDDALKIASQIAAALEAAHDKGVIHRDLKPANIKVAPEGRVKVLDFGLAKSFIADESAPDLTMSPTLTSPATQHGVILGTAPYMSPEQARGKPVDRRTDVWAFGCVLYEMLARRPAFHGETVTDTFAKILEREPDWSALPAATPEPVRRLLARYLAKDPDRRIKDLGYARIVIDECLATGHPGMAGLASGPGSGAADEGSHGGAPGAPPGQASWGSGSAPASGPAGSSLGSAVDRAVSGVADGISGAMGSAGELLERELAREARVTAAGASRWSSWTLLFAILLAALGGFLFSQLMEDRGSGTAASVTYASIPFPEDARADTSLGSRVVAISPDGRRLAFIASQGGIGRIFYRDLDARSLTPLPGTERAASIFFSPDGRWLGFYADDALKSINLESGEIFTVAKSRSQRGGAWAEDGTIYFPMDQLSGLYKVSASGGAAEPVTTLDEEGREMSHRWPVMLPGGRALLLNVELPGSFDEARIDVLNLQTGERKPVAQGGMSPEWSPTGHVVFARNDRLMAVPFDLERLEATGPEIRLSEEVLTFANSGAAQYAVASSGTLAYIGRGAVLNRRLVRVDRDGRVERLSEEPRAIYSLSLSPDGRRIALCVGLTDLWIFERDRGTWTRLTTDDATAQNPIWSPDGRWIVYSSNRGGAMNIWRKLADGSGTAERITDSPGDQGPTSFTPDGKTLLYMDESPQEGWRIFQMDFAPGGASRPFLETPFEESHVTISPDGHWAAFNSTASGGNDVFVTPYPGPGGQWQISNGDSYEPPRWAPDGRAVYYREGNRIMEVDFTPGSPPDLSAPRPYFTDLVGLNSLGGTFAFEPDGSGIITLQASAASARLELALNWTAELEAKTGER